MLLDGFQRIQGFIPFLLVATGTRQLAAHAIKKRELSTSRVTKCLIALFSAGASFPSGKCA